jgi:hypothetical protein
MGLTCLGFDFTGEEQRVSLQSCAPFSVFCSWHVLSGVFLADYVDILDPELHCLKHD